MGWNNLSKVCSKEYKCGHCGSTVASVDGWSKEGMSSEIVAIRICPHCQQPTYFSGGIQVPGVAFGNPVENVPEEINTIYEEARKCTSAGACTAAVMACRKLLMHIAVKQGAKAGENFINYVNYLADKGFVPPHGKHWVDHIRAKGNEANHEIKVMGEPDAKDLITFIEMLLKFIYEFPSKIPKPEQPKT